MDQGPLSEQIIRAFDTMSAQLQTGARYVLARPRDVALLSMREQARQRKEKALWRQYQRAKRHHDPEVDRRIANVYLGVSDSHFERELQLLDLLECPPPLPEEETTPPGDKYQWENEIPAPRHDRESGDKTS